MIKLSDTQAILLSTAAQRADGSLLPLPANLKPGGGATKAMGVLITHGYAEERDTEDAGAVRRVEDDRRIGLFITAAGAAAIGVALPGGDEARNKAAKVETPSPAVLLAAATGKAPAKTSLVLDLMRRPVGATLAELIAVTGWLPHTTRAALTGLRKKGHEITRGRREGVTFYVAVAK
ncbi:DUF3489 domain-containing protein [Sphingomonas bacterium]|uniref:DUF3489 domain-containing protein n=1 Tax=Sphingomonas bacterium TaxID=1895847 RepID=UPI001577048B|nr:DUF3489 domain-containing protein [Sphingomonas bacterium]